MPVNGGSPRQVALDVPEVLEWTLNPATNELAIVSGWGKYEIRVLENFLPRVAAVKYGEEAWASWSSDASDYASTQTRARSHKTDCWSNALRYESMRTWTDCRAVGVSA